MTIEIFFDLFLKELESTPTMRGYYKFLNDEKSFSFRKAYFIQRLAYIFNCIDKNRDVTIWDCGCGYGTTALFLAMNGIKVYGTTLEFYFKEIEQRKEYWKQYGNVDLFQVDYADVFDNSIKKNTYDYIILQDTLHHIEPLQDALNIFANTLKPEGKIIAIEENGLNIFSRLRLFKQRGFKRVIKIWDEHYKKYILLGNENIRSLAKWEKEFAKCNFKITETEYIRYYFPKKYNKSTIEEIVDKERMLAKKSEFLKKYFFFGLNFCAFKNK